ncbi:hypothetical protein CN907_06670 [Bacillus anthracis]|nr:hypothetical protein CN907_06670 [Bacillus anthracis]
MEIVKFYGVLRTIFRMKIKDWVVKGRILIELRKKRRNKEDFINQKVYKRRSVNRLFYFL